MRRLLIVLLLAACTAEEAAKTGTPKPVTPAAPTAAQAREMIANSAELGEHELTNAGWTTPVAGSSIE